MEIHSFALLLVLLSMTGCGALQLGEEDVTPTLPGIEAAAATLAPTDEVGGVPSIEAEPAATPFLEMTPAPVPTESPVPDIESLDIPHLLMQLAEEGAFNQILSDEVNGISLYQLESEQLSEISFSSREPAFLVFDTDTDVARIELLGDDSRASAYFISIEISDIDPATQIGTVNTNHELSFELIPGSALHTIEGLRPPEGKTGFVLAVITTPDENASLRLTTEDNSSQPRPEDWQVYFDTLRQLSQRSNESM